MHANFNSDPAVRHRTECLADACLGCSNTALFDNYSVTVQYAVAAVLISQVHADGHRPRVACLRHLLQTPLRTATLPHGRSPSALGVRFPWELIPSRRTRPSHPISESSKVFRLLFFVSTCYHHVQSH